MSNNLRRVRGVLPTLFAFLFLLQGLPAHGAAEKTRLRVDDYQINVVLGQGEVHGPAGSQCGGF